MRRLAKSCLSVVVAVSLVLSSGIMGVTVRAENIEFEENAVPLTSVNDIDPNAYIDEILEDGIHEWSTVDVSKFIDENDIDKVDTGYIPASFDTMTRNGNYASTAYWNSDHEKGWVVGAGRYTWMQVDASGVVKELMDGDEFANYNLVQANVHITNRYNRTAGDVNTVRYIPDNSWTSPADKNAKGKDLTYNNSQTYFNQGTDIGSGTVKGSTNAMTTSTLTADGLSRFDIGDDYIISLVVYGGGTGADIASSDLTVANNGNQPLIDGYQPSLQLVFSNANQQQIEYVVDRPYALEKIREIVSTYDNTEVAASFTPIGDENDVTVTYSVDDEASAQWIEVADGKIVVKERPTSEQGNQNVVLSVKAQRNNAIFTYDLQMAVLAQQGTSPTAEATLKSIIEFSETTLEEQRNANNIVTSDSDETPGRLSKEAADAFEQVIAEAKNCTDDKQFSNQTKALISKGQEFMSSGTICNDIVYKTKNKYLDSGNTLVYSSYRAKLEGLVWKAKAALKVDPTMYPKSAKAALQEEINRAETALAVDEDGTSMLKLPFTKTRMFWASPDDSMIQYATNYNLIHDTYSQMAYGLEPVLTWYETEHILYNTYSTVELEPVYAGYVRSSGPSYGGNVVIGSSPSDRVGVFQFDLSSIDGAIQSAKLRLVAVNTNAHQSSVYLEEDITTPTWNDMIAQNGSFASAGNGIVSGNKIGSYKPAGKDQYSYAEITDAVIAESAGDGVITFSIQIDAAQTYANEVYGINAVKANYRPVLIVKTSDVSMASLNKTANSMIDIQRNFLESAGTYEGDVKNANVGDFEKRKHDAALAAMSNLESKLKGSNIYEAAEATVEFLDSAYDCRLSMALLSDIDVDENGVQKGNIFYTGEDIKELKERIKTNDNLKTAYQDLKDSVSKVSLNVSQDYLNRWLANDKSLWDENPSFATPQAATTSSASKYPNGRHVRDSSGNKTMAKIMSGHTYTNKAYLTIELAPEDNDTNGYSDMTEDSHCGELWIDNLTITSDDGNDIEVPNGSFETRAVSGDGPMYWTLSTAGNGEGRWESNSANVSSGNRSLYLHNPDGDSSVTWTSSVFDLPWDTASTSEGFEITYNVKQYGIFEHNGVQVKLHFLTEDNGKSGELVSEPIICNSKQKPSVTGVESYTTYMQRAAIMAMFADADAEREKYATLSKIYIQLYLDEINQGVEHWLATNSRPDGIDAYGAVQAGRGAGSLGTAYSIIKNMKDSKGNPIISDEEKQQLTDAAYYLMRDLNDMRDRWELDDDAANTDSSNWISDMNMGATMLGLAFEDTMPNARVHLLNGLRIDESLLLVNINEDGSWPESVRYHNAAISKLAVLAKCLRASMGVDWFANEKLNFYKSFDYLTWIQTPRYASGNASTPFFGDHTLTSGSELYMCGLYYDEVADSHPDAALRMYGTWMNAGTPAPSLSGDDNQLQAFFGHTVDISDYGDYEEAMKEISSTDYAKDFGMFIMRNNFMVKGSESYLVTIIQNEATGHNHNDQLSFIMYADNVPLVIDPGSSPSYWGGSKGNYTGNTQHSLVAYAGKNGDPNQYYDTKTTSTFESFYSSDSLDTVRGTNDHISLNGELNREIAFIKNGFEAYVIWDQVSGADTYGTMMNLPLYTKSKDAITHDGNKFTAKMFGGIDLEITYLEGNYENYNIVTYNANGNYLKRADEDDPKVDHLRIRNEGNDGYLAVLFPKTNKRGNLKTENLGNGVYKLSHSSGNSVYLAVNEGKTSKTVTLPENNLIDLESLNNETATMYADGKVTVSGHSMKLLSTKATTTQEAAETGTGTSTTTPSTPQQGTTSGSSTAGANAGGGAGAPSNDGVNYISGNNSKTDLTVPGVTGVPAASINDAKAEAGKLVFDVNGSGYVYYSVNGGEYQKYDTSVSLAEGKNTIAYFTVDSGTGTKTRAISEVVTVSSANSSSDIVLQDADTAVNVYRNIVTGQKGKITFKDMDGVSVSFKTSNRKVAAVSSKGVITAKKKGKAAISVLVTKDGVTEKVLVNLTVKDKAKVPTAVRKFGNVRTTKAGTPVITITKDMKVSGTSKIIVTKKEGVTLSYKSSDKNVVTVSKNGKITGKSAGTANVIANVKYNGVVQKYQVKVTVK